MEESLNKLTFVTLILISILFTSCAIQSAKKLNFNFSKNMLMPIEEHDISITFHPNSKLLLFVDNMTVNRKKIKEIFGSGFILNKNASLQNVYVEDSNHLVQKVSSFNASYFGNDVTESFLSKIKEIGTIYEIELSPYETGKNQVNITIKYSIKIDDKTLGCSANNTTLLIDDNYFWFPTSPRQSSAYTIQIFTPNRFDVLIDDKKGEEELRSGKFKKTSFSYPSLIKPIVISGKG